MAQINFNSSANLGFSPQQPHMYPLNSADNNPTYKKPYLNENITQSSYDSLNHSNEMRSSEYQQIPPYHSVNGPAQYTQNTPQDPYINGTNNAQAPLPLQSTNASFGNPYGDTVTNKGKSISNYVDGNLTQAFDTVDLNSASTSNIQKCFVGPRENNMPTMNGTDYQRPREFNTTQPPPAMNGFGPGPALAQYNQNAPPEVGFQNNRPPNQGIGALSRPPGPNAFVPYQSPPTSQLSFAPGPPQPAHDQSQPNNYYQQGPPSNNLAFLPPPQSQTMGQYPAPPLGSMPQVNQFASAATSSPNAPSFYPPPGQQPYVLPHQPNSGPPHMGGPGPMGAPGSAYPYTQQPMGYGSPGSAPGQAPGTVKKLDPDSLPNPIQVLDEDKKIKSGLYRCEDNKDSLPPMVTTDFVADNNVNCSPRFIRSTLYCAPCTPDLIKSSAIPLALTISPFAKTNPSESPLPIIDFGEMGPVRCNRCKAYMCSFMLFNDGGRKFYCPFCKTHTEVPPEYFNHLDYNGKRIDLPQRPELFCGSFEMVATKEYCKNNEPPDPPALIFMFDVSYNAMHSGLVPHICKHIKSLLFSLKNGEEDLGDKLKIGIMTYDQMIHFYLAKDPEHPKIVFLPDLTEVFVPSDTEFLLTLDEMIHSIDCITDQIMANFHDTKLTEVILGPAIQASLEALKQANAAGKLIIFHTSLPNMEAPGKLENKDDPKLLGTEKEKNVLLPNSPFYTKLGEACIQAGCGVDLFLFPNSYINLASIGEICRVTGGHTYKYDNFRAEIDGERLVSHVEEVLRRPLAFDAIMKVRTSTGLRPVEYFGNFFMENSTDVEIAVMDSENTITVELKHDDKLSEQENLFIQVAILYTTMSGQRRLRIHNLSMRSSNQYTDIFRMCDLDTLVNLLTKQAVRGVFTATLKQVKEGLSRQCAQILACYRKQCATSSASGQLILPECMKLLPLYVSCLLKSDALLGGVSIKTDDRNWVLFVVRNMSVLDSNRYVYPRLIPLHTLTESVNDGDEKLVPDMVRCSTTKLEKHGVYLLDNGLAMYLWVGSLVNQEFLQDVFGLTLISQIDVNKGLPLLNTPLSERIRSIVSTLQKQAYVFPKVSIIRESDPQASWVKRLLLEDASTVCAEMPSYVDFLCYIHKEIRSMLDS